MQDSQGQIGLEFQVKAHLTFDFFPSLLGSGPLPKMLYFCATAGNCEGG